MAGISGAGLTGPIAAAVGFALSSAANAQVQVLPVQGNVHLLATGGANVAVQVGSDGVVVVDTSTAARAPDVLAAIRQLSDKNIRYVINTHEHPDHVGGNAVISKAGMSFGEDEPLPFASIYAHEHVLNALGAPTGEKPALASEFWPTDTYFTSSMEIHYNGEPIELLHQPAAHTGGDSIVLFRRSDVIVAGDVYLTTGYPVVDIAAGGTINGVIAALNRIIDIAIPRENQEDGTLIVPGEGRISDEYDVVVYRDMVTVIRDRVQEMVKKGSTLEQVLAARPSRDYDTLFTPAAGRSTPAQFVETIYRTLPK
jgi:cyclase